MAIDNKHTSGDKRPSIFDPVPSAADRFAENSFETLIKIALGDDPGPITLGNVDFWLDDNSDVIYDMPTHVWSGVAGALANVIKAKLNS